MLGMRTSGRGPGGPVITATNVSKAPSSSAGFKMICTQYDESFKRVHSITTSGTELRGTSQSQSNDCNECVIMLALTSTSSSSTARLLLYTACSVWDTFSLQSKHEDQQTLRIESVDACKSASDGRRSSEWGISAAGIPHMAGEHCSCSQPWF